MKILILTIILLFSISTCSSQDKETTLQPGNTYNQKLIKGKKHRYEIKLNKGEFCTFVVMQKGVDAVIDVLDPSFKKILSVDSPNRDIGPEFVEFSAVSKGSYHLEVYPLNDYTGMTEIQKNIYIEKNQGDYEIDSIFIFGKDKSSQNKITSLSEGKTYNRKLAMGENQRYKIKLKKNEFCSINIIQLGVNIAVDVLNPSFKKISTFNFAFELNDNENVEFAADEKGYYYIEIYPLNDFSGWDENSKNEYMKQNQGNYEIGSVTVLNEAEYGIILTEEKLEKEKFMVSFNLGLERTIKNKTVPDKWYVGDKDYKIGIDTVTKHSGRNSVLISTSEKSDPNSFGGIGNQIPSVYKAQQIELRAYMKLNDVKDGPIGLWLRLDGSTDMLQFDNMMQKNIQGTSDWTLYSVNLPYHVETRTINFGAFLTGTGQLWVDDFQILIDGKDISEAKQIKQKIYKAEADKEFEKGSNVSSIDLNETTTDNLTLLGKVWGFLKYYHPAITRGEYNWDYELFRILPEILSSENKEESNNVLSAWIDSLGKVKSAKLNHTMSGEIKIKPDLEWINDSSLSEKLISRLMYIRDAERSDTSYYIGLYPGIKNPEFKNENPYRKMKYPDAGVRLLSLYRYWNMIQYFFPYKHLIGEDWNNVLKEFIPVFVNASDELEYKLAVKSLIIRIRDTHADAWEDNTLNDYFGLYHSPVIVSFIENKAVVIDYYVEALGKESGLLIGDVIETINGKPVDEIVKEKLPNTAASNYPTQLRNIAKDLFRSGDSVLTISYARGNTEMTSEIKCVTNDKIDYRKYFQKDTSFKIIGQDISYIYPGTIKNAFLPDIMKEVMKTKGLIIDLRCYPSEFIVFTLSEYLQPDYADFVKFSIGDVTTPGLFTLSKELKVGQKNINPYKGKVVIIINQETQSQAEYTTMAFRTAPNATVIGSTTAGADGNVSEIVLPGAVKTMISGIGVYYPDGTETQRIGIVPDIEVKPTIKGISEGRDELLEKAIEIINER